MAELSSYVRDCIFNITTWLLTESLLTPVLDQCSPVCQLRFFFLFVCLKVWWLNQFGECWANFLIAGLLRAFNMPLSHSSCHVYVVLAFFFFFWWEIISQIWHLPQETALWEVMNCTPHRPPGVLAPDGALSPGLPQGPWQEVNKMAMLLTVGKPMRALSIRTCGPFYECFWGKFICGKDSLLPSWANGLFIFYRREFYPFKFPSLLGLLGDPGNYGDLPQKDLIYSLNFVN